MAKEKTVDVNDKKEVLSEFIAKIANAKHLGNEWVETSKEIVDYYNPKGLNGAKYFIYDGIKVTEHGKSEEIEEENNQSIGQKIHGSEEIATGV